MNFKRAVNNTVPLLKIPLLVGVIALGLYLVGKVPAYIQANAGTREYDTLQEAQTDLGFDIILPMYFPNYLTWPPFQITGEVKPFPRLQTVFVTTDRQTAVLQIIQTTSGSQSALAKLPWIDAVLTEMPVILGDITATLVVGTRNDGYLINGARWTADGYQFAVVTTQPVQELLKIVRSLKPYY